MLFPSLVFLLFLVAVAAAVHVAPSRPVRQWILLGASYYFYAYWDWRFTGLLAFSTAVDFLVAKRIAASTQPGPRFRWLTVSLACNLGLLGFFKYTDFLLRSASVLAGQPVLPELVGRVILPVGISFFTFQTLSYTIDVYRGTLEPTDSLREFALYVAFFPQLVAGPIVRAADFLPQLQEASLPTPRRLWGLKRFVMGMFKKVVVADRLAVFVDVVFAHPAVFDGFTTWFAVGSYAIQIYCDFSGYSDMAIGIAGMLGYEFLENFDHPYVSTTITEFWRRWHISLSSWLRDYLYIPLGGNRAGTARTYRNLMLTMLLGGLWHGAAWNFVLWGAVHGVALAVHRVQAGAMAGWALARSRLWRFLGWLVTMVVVLVAWVLFRAPTFAAAGTVVRTMFTAPGGLRWFYVPALIGPLFLLLSHGRTLVGCETRWEDREDDFWSRTVLCALIWAILLFRERSANPFIYFQF